jgi:hypothetical protein
MSQTLSTLSPDTGLSEDISIADLGRIVGGEEIAAPATPPAAPKKTPEPPAVVEPEPVADAVETPAAEPTENNEAEEPTAEATQEPTPGVKPKEKDASWVDKRLSSLAHKRREAVAALEAEQRKTEQLQRELEALKAQPGPKPPAEDAAPPSGPTAPSLKSFVAALKEGEEYDDAVERYTAAHDAWRDQQRAAQAQQKTQAEAAKTQQETFARDWQAALAVHPDFEDAVERVRSAVPEGLQVAVSQLRNDDDSALWPTMVMYLDEHSEVLTSLGEQFIANPYAATARLGRIAASLTPGTPAPKPAAQTPKKPALKPPVAVGGTAAPSVVDLEKAPMDVFAREVVKYL